jgi:hypothetical protein
MTRLSLWLRSVGLGVFGAVIYGIVHDQITIRISAPYLMDWHPEIIESRDPTLVALAWGVVATWWFGLILGSLLAFAATAGSRPFAPWFWTVRAVGFVFCVAAASALVAFGITRGFGLQLPDAFFGPVYGELSMQERLAFTQAAAMHETSYDAAGVATLLAAIMIWRQRRSLPGMAPNGAPTL